MDVVKMDSDCAAHGDGAQELLHVLAVDDSLVDRKLIERLLKLSCCKVTAVESGTRALQYLGLDGEKSSVGLDDLKVNLIITDYSMPGMTGFELLQKIKGSPKSKEIPVVIMSSENILARIDRCLEEGAEDYLLKPVKLADVQRLRDFTLRGETKDEKDITSCNRKTADDKCSSLSPPSPSPLFAPSLLNSDNPLPSSFAPSPLNCDNLMSSFATSPLNCDTPMSPMLVSAESHQLLTKRPSLLVASD